MAGDKAYPRDQEGSVGARVGVTVLYPEVPIPAYPVLMNRTGRAKMRRKQGVGFTEQQKGASAWVPMRTLEASVSLGKSSAVPPLPEILPPPTNHLSLEI